MIPRLDTPCTIYSVNCEYQKKLNNKKQECSNWSKLDRCQEENHLLRRYWSWSLENSKILRGNKE